MHAVVNKKKTYMASIFTDWYTIILLAVSKASQTIFIKTLTLWTLVGITDLCSNALLAFRTQQEEIKRLLRNSTSVCEEIPIFLLQSLRKAASTYTRTHQCDSLEEFTSSIALIWRHFWESVRFFFSIPVEKKKNGAELPKVMNRNLNGTTAHCGEQHFCHVSGSTWGLPQIGVPEKQGVSCEWNTVDRFQPVTWS